MANSNSSFLDWWFQGLGIFIPKTVKHIFNSKKARILLQFTNDQNQGDQNNTRLAVIWPSNKKDANNQAEYYSLDGTTDQKAFLDRLSKYNKEKNNVSLCIPANKGLRTILKLPLSAESDLNRILEFEIERQTPFRREDVYSGYKLINKNLESNMLDVELNVIPKKSVDSQLSDLNKIGVSPKIVELENDSPGNGINVLQNKTKGNEHKTTKRVNFVLSFLTISLALIALAVPLKQINWTLKETQHEINLAKKEAFEINHLKSSWEKSLDKKTFINNKVNSRKSVTEILDELTTIIPDNAWLNRLQIRGDTIRLHGESSAATSLIGIIDQSINFGDARFQSPVTNNVTTGNDRFQITAKIIHRNADQENQLLSK